MNTDYLTDQVITFLLENNFDPEGEEDAYQYVYRKCFPEGTNRVSNLFYNQLISLNWKYIEISVARERV